MARRISLPLTGDVPPAENPPTADAIRKKLGGRATSEPCAGEIVSLGDPELDRIGVVLFGQGDEVAVWIAEGLVRRTRRSQTTPFRSAVPPALAKVATDAKVV